MEQRKPKGQFSHYVIWCSESKLLYKSFVMCNTFSIVLSLQPQNNFTTKFHAIPSGGASIQHLCMATEDTYNLGPLAH